MPVTNFQPVIGSSFDAVTGQQFQWTQANRQQEEANIARQLQANRDYNAWLATVSQMNRQDAAMQQGMAREDFQIAASREAQAARDAEARRQFNESLTYSREAEKARRQDAKTQFEQQLALTRAEEDKQRQVLENFGSNYVDTVKQAGAQYASSQQEYARAQQAIMTFGQEQAKEIGSPYVTYDSRQGKLIASSPRMPIPDNLMPKVLAANERISQKAAEYAGVKDTHDAAERHWMDVQKQVSANGFIVKGEGDDAFLYSPVLGKSFGEMVKAAGGTSGTGTTGTDFTPSPLPANAMRVGSVSFASPGGGFTPAVGPPVSAGTVTFRPGPVPAAEPAVTVAPPQTASGPGSVSVGGVRLGPGPTTPLPPLTDAPAAPAPTTPRPFSGPAGVLPGEIAPVSTGSQFLPALGETLGQAVQEAAYPLASETALRLYELARSRFAPAAERARQAAAEVQSGVQALPVVAREDVLRPASETVQRFAPVLRRAAETVGAVPGQAVEALRAAVPVAASAGVGAVSGLTAQAGQPSPFVPARPVSPAAPAFPPAPENPADRVMNQIYSTPRGAYRWTTLMGKPTWQPVHPVEAALNQAGRAVGTWIARAADLVLNPAQGRPGMPAPTRAAPVAPERYRHFDQVMADYRAGRISKSQAITLAREKFGWKPSARSPLPGLFLSTDPEWVGDFQPVGQ